MDLLNENIGEALEHEIIPYLEINEFINISMSSKHTYDHLWKKILLLKYPNLQRFNITNYKQYALSHVLIGTTKDKIIEVVRDLLIQRLNKHIKYKNRITIVKTIDNYGITTYEAYITDTIIDVLINDPSILNILIDKQTLFPIDIPLSYSDLLDDILTSTKNSIDIGNGYKLYFGYVPIVHVDNFDKKIIYDSYNNYAYLCENKKHLKNVNKKYVYKILIFYINKKYLNYLKWDQEYLK